MIAIKNALFPIPLRIDPPIGASGKAHPPPPGEDATLRRHSNRRSARFRHLIEDAKRPGQLSNTAAALCSSQNCHLEGELRQRDCRAPTSVDIVYDAAGNGGHTHFADDLRPDSSATSSIALYDD
jgi:hypothetical protein